MDSNAVEEARTRANMMPGVSKDIRLLPYTVLGSTSPTIQRDVSRACFHLKISVTNQLQEQVLWPVRNLNLCEMFSLANFARPTIYLVISKIRESGQVMTT